MSARRDVEHRLRVGAARRIDLDRDHELARGELSLQKRLDAGLRGHGGELALVDDERSRRTPVLVDRLADGGDLSGRATATAADDPCAELLCMRRELCEVLRGRVGEDDTGTGQAREPEIRHHRERQTGRAHLLDRTERGVWPCAVVCADRGDVLVSESCGRLLGADAAERERVLVEGQERDHGQRRHRADGGDGGQQPLHVEERLDGEEIDSAPLEQLRLLCVDRGLVLLDVARIADRPDRPRDEDLAAGDVARFAGDLDRGLVDLPHLVVEEPLAELVAVGAERVRLDELCTGADEAEMEREHALGRAQICLLRAAQPWNRAREEGAHPTVRDDRRSGRKPLQKALCHGDSL